MKTEVDRMNVRSERKGRIIEIYVVFFVLLSCLSSISSGQTEVQLEQED